MVPNSSRWSIGLKGTVQQLYGSIYAAKILRLADCFYLIFHDFITSVLSSSEFDMVLFYFMSMEKISSLYK